MNETGVSGLLYIKGALTLILKSGSSSSDNYQTQKKKQSTTLM
jgi:hypothetical protein